MRLSKRRPVAVVDTEQFLGGLVGQENVSSGIRDQDRIRHLLKDGGALCHLVPEAFQKGVALALGADAFSVTSVTMTRSAVVRPA